MLDNGKFLFEKFKLQGKSKVDQILSHTWCGKTIHCSQESDFLQQKAYSHHHQPLHHHLHSETLKDQKKEFINHRETLEALSNTQATEQVFLR